ncbi:TPA: hypothetical protein MDR95_004863 [Klebsiella pneumoniae]|uniref:hypothetical protein n=1 Tax=Enterobacter cloacae complex TaxID=354276 RepID=UPI001DBBE3A4|nr:hypothetical protein [Enterobacter cloacae]MCE1480265.1 hypothetical protein [Enterobacter hormaechei]HBX5317681.1 hypothetical protein [Klebsiella pneumoniae]HDH0729450.1 hypothetical protein [Klebsiella aerogenes]EKX4083352.1 hypothetical protein [Enterobacter cloacae]MDR9915117.1 hypothetical protein [Enterobacter cloacae subsp. cloacae]
MNKYYTTVAAMTLMAALSSISGAAENDIIKVDIQKNIQGINVTVTAKTDTVLIKNIDVNRGKCPLLTKGTVTYQGKRLEGWVAQGATFTPATMHFSDGLTWHFGHTYLQPPAGVVCSFLEARVFTDQGIFTVTE